MNGSPPHPPQQSLSPAFDFPSDRGSVVLRKGPVGIEMNGKPYTGTGEAVLDLLPRPWVHFNCTFRDVLIEDRMGACCGIKPATCFSMEGRQVEGVVVEAKSSIADQDTHIRWASSSSAVVGVGDDSTTFVRLVGHLFNFVEFTGTRFSFDGTETTCTRIEHLDLACREWEIEIKSLASTAECFKRMKAEGGYQLTHLIGIRKPNSAPFSGAEAQSLLNALHFFLSFAKGTWCSPACAVGYDESANRVWEEWSTPGEPWCAPQSWFTRSGSQLAELFPRFMQRWANKDWNQALRDAIYWHVSANTSSRGTDTGLILSQTAIERLAFELAVEDKKLLTRQGFEKLWASDHFRLLFSSLGIPLGIPAEAESLTRLGANRKWLDAPHALTDIRNSIVHPETKRCGQFDSVAYEAWNLGQWYLEMAILAICGYVGKYSNRLKHTWVWESEKVPWA